MSKQKLMAKSQAGFTLVELAIVMIIIGLLIAGVLKGQALIGNARVTSTIAQIKAIDAATSTFKDTYASLPGDLVGAGTRLPNCTASPCLSAGAGLGDGRLANTPAAAPTAASSEGLAFFPQLATADLLTGIAPSATNPTAWGVNFPAAKIDGNGFFPGSSIAANATDLTSVEGGSPARASSGLYLSLVATVANVGTTTATTGLSPTQAFRIDTKLDDGVPATGAVLGIGSAGATATNCGTGTATGAYATVGSSSTCGLYVRIQG